MAPLFDDRKDVLVIEDSVVLALQLDFGAAMPADQHAVTFFDFAKQLLAILADLARPHSNDDAFDGFFLRRIGNNNFSFRAFPGPLFRGLNEDAVTDRSDVES